MAAPPQRRRVYRRPADRECLAQERRLRLNRAAADLESAENDIATGTARRPAWSQSVWRRMTSSLSRQALSGREAEHRRGDDDAVAVGVLTRAPVAPLKAYLACLVFKQLPATDGNHCTATYSYE